MEPVVDPWQRARQICLRELATRPRTRSELAAALRRGGIDDDVAGAVLERYDEVGIVDDEAFAKAWVTSRHAGRGLARRALAAELRRKGVQSETVDEALTELDPDTELATARALVVRRLRSLRRDRPEAMLRRLIAMLARKGYSPAVAARVVRDVIAEEAQRSGDAQDAQYAADIDVDAFVDAVEGEDSYAGNA